MPSDRQSPRKRRGSRLDRLKAEMTAIPKGIAAILRRGGKERAIDRKAAEAALARAAAGKGKILDPNKAATITTTEGGKTKTRHAALELGQIKRLKRKNKDKK